MGLNKSHRLQFIESLESRQLMSAADSIRSYDGSGNNISHWDWGRSGTTLIRLAKAGYADGKSTPAGAGRSSARAISNAVAAHPAETEITSREHLSAYAYLWGQFVDHDIDLTSNAAVNGALNVAVPKGDPYFDPAGTGAKTIGMNRSNGVVDAKGVRQQINDITAFIDGSMVYGSDSVRAAALRTFAGGKLKTSSGGLLPYNTAGLPNDNNAHVVADDKLFLAGDVRANENAELTAIQTLFVREHNRLASSIAAKNPSWNDERVYQQARRLVVGEIQNITYNEFLPALLGPQAIAKYRGYKPDVNPAVSNEFSTAAFRVGHTMLADDVEFINDDGTEAAPELPLANAFSNPAVLETNGIETMLKYLASTNAEEIDNKVVDGVRNFLFGPPGSGGFDLASLNIQRGRDHGLAGYNDTRVALGLTRLTKFEQISSDAAVVANLKSVYKSVDDVDLWVGGLAEDHVGGGNVGPTFQKIIADQFTRLRDGDRFYFENDLTGSDLSMVKGMTLSKVVKANTSLKNIQEKVFTFNTTVAGTIFADYNGNGKKDLLEPFIPGATVQMYDGEDAVVASVRSDLLGRYSFSGVQLGAYRVVVSLPSNSSFASSTQTFFCSTEQSFTGRDVGLSVRWNWIGAAQSSARKLWDLLGLR